MLHTLLTSQEDFTGEFKKTPNTGAIWRLNESAPVADAFADASGNGRSLMIANWSGTTAVMLQGHLGRYLRYNTNSPTTEKTHLYAINPGNFFSNLGKRLVVGGWINPATYSIASTYIPLFSTRHGPGQPLIYTSLLSGKLRVGLYNSSGSLFYDTSEATQGITFTNTGWYFIATVVDLVNETVQNLICDRDNGTTWKGPVRSYTGTPNASCVADITLGMLANAYYYAGGMDDWWFETNSDLTIDELEEYFLKTYQANGGNSAAGLDAISVSGEVRLASGFTEATLVSRIIELPAENVDPIKIRITGSYTEGVNAIQQVQTRSSDALTSGWTNWQTVNEDGSAKSKAAIYWQIRMTLITTNAAQSPSVTEVELLEEPVEIVPVIPYANLGYARPVVLDAQGWPESVLDNAYDIILSKELNGSDTLEFNIPFSDGKRASLASEKTILMSTEKYKVRTITDERSEDGKLITHIYAEAAFYDLAYFRKPDDVEYKDQPATVPLAYALDGTGWTIGEVTVSTIRSWQCMERSALAVLRMIRSVYGGDLVFDNGNRTVSLLTSYGSDTGAAFAYRKNMRSIKRVVDTRTLITRLYAYGADGITFASINGGKPYVEDFTYTSEVRSGSLDLSNFTSPQQMLQFTQMRMADYAKPNISYEMQVMDLSVLSGWEHENFSVGDLVTVDDQELDIRIKTRIVRMDYNVQEPWRTKIELSTTLRSVSSGGSHTTEIAEPPIGYVQGSDLQGMVVYNHLLNSRADDGLASWINSGFEVDPANGASGDASFKCTGSSGVAKSLEQVVTPSHRSAYTVSAMMAHDNVQMGQNGKVGIELTVTYDDDTTETVFVDLFA